MEETSGSATGQTENADKKERSTIKFAYGDLEDAEQVAEAVHKEGDTTFPDRLAAALGHETVTSGAFNHKVSTALVFNLIERDGKQIRLTSLGRRIVNPALRLKARVDAFLGVDLYQKVFDAYRGGNLPPDSGLENFIKGAGVAEKQATKARQAMKRSAEFAGFFQFGNEKMVMPNTGNGQQDMNGAGGKPKEEGSDIPSRKLHPAIQGMLEGLPSIGEKWTESQEVEWLEAFGHVLKVFHREKNSTVKTVPAQDEPSSN